MAGHAFQKARLPPLAAQQVHLPPRRWRQGPTQHHFVSRGRRGRGSLGTANAPSHARGRRLATLPLPSHQKCHRPARPRRQLQPARGGEVEPVAVDHGCRHCPRAQPQLRGPQPRPHVGHANEQRPPQQPRPTQHLGIWPDAPPDPGDLTRPVAHPVQHQRLRPANLPRRVVLAEHFMHGPGPRPRRCRPPLSLRLAVMERQGGAFPELEEAGRKGQLQTGELGGGKRHRARDDTC